MKTELAIITPTTKEPQVRGELFGVHANSERAAHIANSVFPLSMDLWQIVDRGGACQNAFNGISVEDTLDHMHISIFWQGRYGRLKNRVSHSHWEAKKVWPIAKDDWS